MSGQPGLPAGPVLTALLPLPSVHSARCPDAPPPQGSRALTPRLWLSASRAITGEPRVRGGGGRGLRPTLPTEATPAERVLQVRRCRGTR